MSQGFVNDVTYMDNKIFLHWIILLTQHFSSYHFSKTVRDIDFCLQTMMFKIIHDKCMLKSLINDNLIHFRLAACVISTCYMFKWNPMDEMIFFLIVFCL